MNSTPRSQAQIVTLRDRVLRWRDLLEQCGQKPTRKRVHALRVVTLRLQAELSGEASELPRASHQAQAMLRFDRQAEKLRHLLGSVRELDVWTAMLMKLRRSLEQGAYTPRTTRETVRQLVRLEERLKKKRRSAAEKLATAIGKRRDHLLTEAEEVGEAVRDHHDADLRAADAILGQFAAIVQRFPSFDEENLHDFRKSIKTVRYLAEVHQSGDPRCVQIGAQLKRLQGAIGEWHDWWALAHELTERQRARTPDLSELLDSLSRESFETALTACNNVIERILDSPGKSLRPTEPKPPVRIEEHIPVLRHKNLA